MAGRLLVWIGVGTAALAALFVSAVVVAVHGPDARDYVFPEPFDADCLRGEGTAAPDAACNPWPMRYSLVRDHGLVGMPRSDAEALLGRRLRGDEVSVPLGMSNHGVNVGVLVLRFDASGHVASYAFRES